MITNIRPGSFVINWKPYFPFEDTITKLKALVKNLDSDQKIYVALSYNDMKRAIKENLDERFIFGMNHMNSAYSNHFTGSIAATLVKDGGGQFVLIGNSEHETPEDVRQKIIAALSVGLVPVVYLKDEPEQIFKDFTQEQLDKVVIIYKGDIEAFKNQFPTPEILSEILPFSEEISDKNDLISGYYTSKGPTISESIPKFIEIAKQMKISIPYKISGKKIDVANLKIVEKEVERSEPKVEKSAENINEEKSSEIEEPAKTQAPKEHFVSNLSSYIR